VTFSSLPPWLIELKHPSHHVYIHTAGCTYNHGDSHKLRDILRAHHVSIVDTLSDATAVIVNSCTVIAKTEREMLRIFREVTRQEKALYITGCMPVVQREEILEICTPIFITSDELHFLHAQITPRWDVAQEPPQNNVVAIVQIAHGCLGTCQYCLTRLARGPLVSVPMPHICSEISWAISNGAVEIQLTAQDMSAYGMDQTGRSELSNLLQTITEIPGDFCVRVGMMNPRTLHPVAKEVAAAFSHKKIFSFAHIPIQAGTDPLLAAMGRGYTVSTFLDTIHLFEQVVPDLLIGTDVIVGFPGETETDIDALLSLLQTIKPYRLNVTRYSPRKGTPAYHMYDMPDRFKKDRSRRISSAFQEMRSECNKILIGKEFEVYITEKKEKGFMARTDSYHAVVIQSNEMQEEMTTYTPSCGDRTIVKITGERVHYLVGSVYSGKDRC
jgi:MiaB-like tRNA modifying enzyme